LRRSRALEQRLREHAERTSIIEQELDFVPD